MLKKQEKRKRRHKRGRVKIIGTNEIPRLCVFRSPKHIYAQLINDEKGKTLISVSDQEIKKPKFSSVSKKEKAKNKEEKTAGKGKIAVAYELGKLIAKKALDYSSGSRGKKIEKIVFDRGGYKYHGRVKALAEGAREGGLKF